LRVLITGITGLIGSHLADYLLELGDVEIFALKRWRSDEANIKHLFGKVHLIEGDIQDAASVKEVIDISRPDKIFHLAAQSYLIPSWQAPALTMQVNVVGTINLLEAVRNAGLDPFIHIAGSSASYGIVREEDVPIKETHPIRPLSPYGISKATQDMLGHQYYHSYGMKIVVTRSFNHVGPRQGERCSAQTFARQVAEIEASLREPVIYVGNLKPKRDFSDVKDIVKALWLLSEKGRIGESYNLCSGKAVSIQTVLDTILSLSDIKVEVQVDPARLRPSDEPILMGDNSKLKQDTGWEPKIPLEVTLKDILDSWRVEARKTSQLVVNK